MGKQHENWERSPNNWERSPSNWEHSPQPTGTLSRPRKLEALHSEVRIGLLPRKKTFDGEAHDGPLLTDGVILSSPQNHPLRKQQISRPLCCSGAFVDPNIVVKVPKKINIFAQEYANHQAAAVRPHSLLVVIDIRRPHDES